MTDWQSLNPIGSGSSDMPTGTIPVLTEVVLDRAVSPALRDALDARAQEKSDWMSMEAHLLHTLRPEMERLTTELVRVGLRETWRRRSEN